MTKGNRLCSLVAVLLILVSALAGSLELTKGRMKLVLHEGLGRFTLYYMTDLREQTYVPLFVVQDPRTSSLSILDGNRTFRLGDASQFSEEVVETVNGAQFIWESSTFRIVQDFEFITSESASLADGVVVTLTITNRSEQTTSVGARYIFDTELGEDGNVHFSTPSTDEVSRETEVTPSASQWYWRSPSQETPGVGVQQIVFGSGVTAPSRVVFANWKRLNESSWDYQIERRRNFNLLPYSINDSAAAVYFPGQSLAAGESREIVSIFGNISDGGYVLRADADSGLSRVFQQVVTGDGGEATESAVRADLIAVEDLIEQIDSLLANPSEISENDVEVLRNVIEELEERQADYE